MSTQQTIKKEKEMSLSKKFETWLGSMTTVLERMDARADAEVSHGAEAQVEPPKAASDESNNDQSVPQWALDIQAKQDAILKWQSDMDAEINTYDQEIDNETQDEAEPEQPEAKAESEVPEWFEKYKNEKEQEINALKQERDNAQKDLQTVEDAQQDPLVFSPTATDSTDEEVKTGKTWDQMSTDEKLNPMLRAYNRING